MAIRNRILCVAFPVVLALAGSACKRSEKAQETRRNRADDSAARAVGRGAYKASREAGKALKKAGKELGEGIKEASEGWKDARRESGGKK